MRLLFTSNLFPPDSEGGYELRLYHLIEALRHEHDVTVVTSVSPATKVRDSAIPYRVLRVMDRREQGMQAGFTGQLSELWRSQTQAIRFAEILDTESPDYVCHFNLSGWSPAVAAVCRIKGITQCFWYEDTWSSRVPLKGNSILHPWYQIHQEHPKGGFARLAPLLRPLLPTGSGVGRNLKLPGLVEANLKIAVSHYQEWKNRSDFVAAKRSEIIRAGIPMEDGPPTETNLELHQPLKLVYAGALTPDRGFAVLFEALRSMDAAQQRQFRLTVIGKPPNSWAESWWKQFRANTEKDPAWEIIQLAGWVAPREVGKHLEKHDVLVFPSQRGEGYPLILQEAMYRGCTILATGSGGAGELCQDAGIEVFPAGCPGALKARLLKILENPDAISRERKRLRKYALQHFNIRQTARDFVAMIQEHHP